MPPTFRLRHVLQLAAILLLSAATGLWGYHLRMRGGLSDLRALGHHRLELAAASLEREIDKYAYFPATLGLERNVLDLLHRSRPDRVAEVNAYLEQVGKRSGALAVYILDAGGQVVASSNWNMAESFMGEDLSYRPYFYEAVVHGSGRFFGIGTTLGVPGYYLSSAINDGGHVVGVAVVKVSLEQLERSWPAVEVPVLVTDGNGVIILSSEPGWKFFTLKPLDAKTREDFNRSQQYNRRRLDPLPIGSVEELDADTRLMSLPRLRPAAGEGVVRSGKVRPLDVVEHIAQVRHEFLAQSMPMAMPLQGAPWTLTVMTPLGQLRTRAVTEGALAASGAVIVGILVLLMHQRTAQGRERQRAREALQQAHDELERKVDERTADLSAANQRLVEEVAERTRAERVLRAAQDELVQAGKLAVIGQLSAGIAHELNQPLAALRTLSANAARFMERGDLTTAAGNLERIGVLVDNMGRITSQLKGFARKSSGRIVPVPVRPALENALFLLDGRLRKAGVTVALNLPDGDLSALCEPNRLEQVLVNLIGNAADAMDGQTAAALEIGAVRHGGRVVISVRDHGPGIGADAAAHLFEPFFTTKEQGVGLGLGLPISAGIIRDFGGNLDGANHPGGGAVFTVDLPAAEAETA